MTADRYGRKAAIYVGCLLFAIGPIVQAAGAIASPDVLVSEIIPQSNPVECYLRYLKRSPLIPALSIGALWGVLLHSWGGKVGGSRRKLPLRSREWDCLSNMSTNDSSMARRSAEPAAARPLHRNIHSAMPRQDRIRWGMSCPGSESLCAATRRNGMHHPMEEPRSSLVACRPWQEYRDSSPHT